MDTKNTLLTGALVLGIMGTAGAGFALADDSATAGQRGMGHGHRGGDVAAELLGITEDEFRARIDAGENPRDMLEDAGITKEDIHAAHEARMKEHLAAQVANGTITQAEADERLTKHAEHEAAREATRIAIENNDYAAWATAAEGTPMASQITAETFSALVQAHTLREAGDHEGAHAVLDAAGITPPEKGGKGHGKHRGSRGAHNHLDETTVSAQQ